MAKKQDLELQVSRLEAHVNELNAQLNAYRSREQDVVAALTEARNNTSRRLSEAEEQARQIIQAAEDKANQTMKAAEAQGMAFVRKAEAREMEATTKAEQIVSEAEREATQTLAQMRQAAKEIEGQLARLNATLRETAQRAHIQADAFAKTMNGLRMAESELGGEIAPVQPASVQSAFSLPLNPTQSAYAAASYTEPAPVRQTEHAHEAQITFSAIRNAGAGEEYEDPQKVIQGIYQLQGRSIPPEAVNKAEETVQHSYVSPTAGNPAYQPVEKPTPQPAASPVVERPVYQPVEQQPYAAPVSPAAQAAFSPAAQAYTQPAENYTSAQPVMAPPVPAAPAKQRHEEKLWTVDEVLGTASLPADPGAGTLDSLLDEIMGGPATVQSVPPVRQDGMDLDSLLDEIIGN